MPADAFPPPEPTKTVNVADPTATPTQVGTTLHGLPTEIQPQTARQLILEPRDGHCRVRGMAALNALHFAHQRAGKQGVRAVMDMLAHDDAVILAGSGGKGGHNLRPSRWIPFALHCRLLRAVDAALGTGDLALAFDVGHHTAERDIPRLFRPFMKIGRPGWIIDASTKLWRYYHRDGTWTIDRDQTELLARLEGHDEADEAFCRAFEGWVSAAMEKSGAKHVEPTHIACKARGAPACVFTLRWR